MPPRTSGGRLAEVEEEAPAVGGRRRGTWSRRRRRPWPGSGANLRAQAAPVVQARHRRPTR
ncbi:MAG: hypothetical protein MZW92_28285 [Comamonadaceae bacterium]|nr:hypothetical protein [Comamonadaceae bacterium]